jgi:hypothetical protein
MGEMVLGELSQGTIVARNFGLRARKSQGFLELGSQRGCSYLTWRLIFSWGKKKNRIR